MELRKRYRRLRENGRLRGMVRETRMSPDALIYPVFTKEGHNIKEEISSMEGQYRYSVDRLGEALEELLDRGVDKVMFFGLPGEKDEIATGAWAEEGIVQKALRYSKEHYPEVYRITDVCMCEYTSHGHCGILCGHDVDNDKTLEYLAKIALSQVEAGAQMVAPSDMMDARVAAIRRMLDKNGHLNVPIMAYSAKYCSAFYGPFRDAADSSPSFGDRKSYQMDYHNKKEAIKEVLTDIDEGADIVMVKPALAYLDVLQTVASQVNVPVAAYSVSGEYSMIKAAAKAGFIDEAAIACETAVSIFRAGADILITYYAKEIADWIKEGRIG